MAKAATILASTRLWASLSAAGWIGWLLKPLVTDLRAWAVGKMMDGQYEELAARLDTVVGGIAWVASSIPSSFWLGVAVSASLVLLMLFLRRTDQSRSSSQKASRVDLTLDDLSRGAVMPPAGFGAQDQRTLAAILKQYANEHSEAKILFAGVKHRKLAETLISIFALAGWRTNLINVPLESYRQEYIEGVEVLGWNRHLVSAVAEELTKAGIADVRSKVEVPATKQDNPKWPYTQNRVRITIGHH